MRSSRHIQLDRLEDVIANDPEILQEEAHRQRRIRERLKLKQFLMAFPREYRVRVLKRLKAHGRYDGLVELRYCAGNGVWQVKEIPAAVADVYLEDPKATPWLRCKACDLLLPKRSGIWHNTETGGWWQSSMRYFAHCPACQGEIVPRGEDRSWQKVSPFPVRPEGCWEFLDQPPIANLKRGDP